MVKKIGNRNLTVLYPNLCNGACYKGTALYFKLLSLKIDFVFDPDEMPHHVIFHPGLLYATVQLYSHQWAMFNYPDNSKK